jgi:hypothetical protein
MTTQQISKGLRWMRDYGILMLTIVIIALTVAYFRHDYTVTKDVVPNVINNTEMTIQNISRLEKNTIMIDSLYHRMYYLEQKLGQSYYEKFPDEYALIYKNKMVADSLQREIEYLKSLAQVPYYVRFPEVQQTT